MAARVGERKKERRQRELDGSEESWEQEEKVIRPKNQMKRGCRGLAGQLSTSRNRLVTL